MNAACRARYLVMRATLVEALRRKDVWVLLILMFAFAVVAVGSRLTGNATLVTGTFMLNLGLTLATLFAHLLTVLLAVRQFPDEIENRTLYPLLARPLSRGTLVIGKWLACGGVGVMSLWAFQLLTWAATPATEPMNMLTGLQAWLLLPISLFWASAFAIALSLYLPKAPALCLGLVGVLAGEKLHGWWAGRLPLGDLLPRFGMLNITTRLTDGIAPLDAVAFTRMLVYGVIWTILCLGLAHLRFQRRAL